MRFARMFIILLAAALFVSLAGSPTSAQAQVATPTNVTWQASYWNNTNLSGDPVLQRLEAQLDYRWLTGSPAEAVTADTFSARWTATVQLDQAGYRFTTVSDDGVRLYVDGRRLIDNWTVHATETDSAIIPLDAGAHTIEVEYFEQTGLARIAVGWTEMAQTGDESIDITPEQGPPGTTILVGASGFAPNTPVVVGIGRANTEPTTSVDASTNAEGAVQTTIDVPVAEARPGEPWRILVRAPATGESVLSGDFMVTGAGDGQPCGDTVTVQPGDWLARIARRCDTSIPALLALNPGITNPSLLFPGQVLELPAADASAQVGITPNSGPVGTAIRVSATGFEPTSPVRVALGRAQSEPSRSLRATTDAAGNLSTAITVPTSARPGEPWVVLVDGLVHRALSETFTVTGADVSATLRFNTNLRALPTVASERLDLIPAGTGVPVLARNPDGDWLLVRYQGRQGWVAGWLAQLDGRFASLPVETP